MKYHYVSPYGTTTHRTICGKLISANVYLVADMQEVTCKSCRQLLIGYCDYRLNQIFTELVNAIDAIDMKIFDGKPFIPLKTKLERLKNCNKEVYRLRKIWAQLTGVM